MSTSRFIARQPIFDQHAKVYGYELLFRSGCENFFSHPDGDAASKMVIDNFFLLGLETLTAGRRAFINCTRDILVRDFVSLLPRQRVVLEVLETVDADAEVVSALTRLKQDGYSIALDDYVDASRQKPLVDLAEFVKVDFALTRDKDRGLLASQLARPGLSLLAEKVETQEEFNQARDMGYDYAQGYFFAKPEIVAGRDVPGFKLNYLRILQEINRPDVELSRVEAIIKQEASLCFKLLRYLNSVLFGFREEVKSIRHALALLGERELRKWASLVAVAAMAEDKPQELVVNSLVRARFAELLAPATGLNSRATDLFLMGLLSLMDAILDQPMTAVLENLPVAEDIKSALVSWQGPFARIYEIILAQETANWADLNDLAAELRLGESQATNRYLESVEWARSIFEQA